MPSTPINPADFYALQDQVTSLGGEVQSLRSQLNSTRGELRALQNTVSEAFEDTGSDGPFTLISELRDSEALTYSAKAPPTQVPSAASQAPVTPKLDSTRVCAAQSVGKFLRRAVSGLPRGPSGRDQITQASRYWVVVRSFDNIEYKPVRVFSKWAAAKQLVKRGSDLGDAVFVGLPSIEDINTAVQAGEFEWGGLIEG